jgi:hypothetical protein
VGKIFVRGGGVSGGSQGAVDVKIEELSMSDAQAKSLSAKATVEKN